MVFFFITTVTIIGNIDGMEFQMVSSWYWKKNNGLNGLNTWKIKRHMDTLSYAGELL